jgi:hypothetical protein
MIHSDIISMLGDKISLVRTYQTEYISEGEDIIIEEKGLNLMTGEHISYDEILDSLE